MDSPKTPAEVLNHAIARATWLGGARRPKGKPGEIIASMSEEDRALLRELKSEDISPEKLSPKVAWLGTEDERSNMAQLISEECLKFDKDKLRLN